MAQPELIKDIEARVKKSGDTMTGKLYTTSNLDGSLACANTNGAFRIDGGTDYQTGAFLSLNGTDSPYYPNAFQLVASNGITRKELFGNTDGTLTWDNNIILHNGNFSNYALPLSGGTMTGSITMSNNAILTPKSSSITQSAPSSTTYYEPIQWYDANNKRIGAIGTTLYSNGEIATHIQVQREINGVDKYQHLYMIIDSNGDGYCKTTKLYGAVWNDYAEYRSSDPVEPGRVICETGNGTLKLSTERLQPGANVVSDTFGFAIGETENCKTPIAVSGRALVYTYEDRYSYEAGDPVCAAPGGTVSKMSREEVMMYPDRIVGTVSEIPEYERWGTGNVEVKNRIWIKVK